jgi:tol-pal system protein YbgF
MSRRTRNAIAAAAVALLAGAGCSPSKTVRMPETVDILDARVASIQEQQALLQSSLTEIKETLARQEEILRSLRADTQTRFSELTTNMDTVRNKMEESMQRRSLFQSAPPVSTLPPAGLGQMPDSTGAQGSMSPSEIKRIYDDAYLDLNRGNYSLALMGFQSFLRRAPQSELADNAQYWIGECYYAQRDFARAIDEFRLVERNHPDGEKVPSALLKIAYSHLQLEDRGSARDVLNDLIARYPRSEEAAQAKSKLQSIR